MRITVIGPSYPFRGGIAHYTALLCSALAARHEVNLVSLSRQYPRILFPGKKQTDESQVQLKVDNSEPLIDSMNPLSWIKAVKSIKKCSPDLVIIQWWHPFFAPAFGTIASRCLEFANVMFICHNVVPHEKSGPTVMFTKYALSKGDMFIVHSGEDWINLKNLMPHALTRKTPHPTYEVFNATPVEREDARMELGISPDEKVVLFFGLVRKYKGLKYLIEAMPRVLSEMDVTLLIVGEFYDDREPYLQLIKDLGIENKVKLRDEYVPNEKVSTFFSSSDVVVLPYVSATQSGIVQIAYAFEKPVVTTNVGGLPEAVKDGETGFVVPSENSEAIAQGIIRFFKEEKSAEFASNIRVLREEFSWDRMVETVEGLVTSGGS